MSEPSPFDCRILRNSEEISFKRSEASRKRVRERESGIPDRGEERQSKRGERWDARRGSEMGVGTKVKFFNKIGSCVRRVMGMA